MTVQPLYRAEAVAYATQRLDGEVLLPGPLVTWGAVAFLVAVLALTVWFAATATYTRTTSGQGWLAPEGGVTRAISRREGSVLALIVAEGDVVEVGAPLARVGSPRWFGDRYSWAPNPKHSKDGTYQGSPFDDVATETMSDAENRQAVPSAVAFEQAVARAARELLWGMAELTRQGMDGSFDELLSRDGDHIVRAPISGRVDALVAQEGQYIYGDTTVALIAASDELIAEVAVPLHVAGLVTSGQDLRLKYEGLRFGHQVIQQGIVSNVSRAPLAPDDIEQLGVPVAGPVYRVQVRLPTQEIHVDGASVGLHAGMRLTAEIPTPRRTLFQALYETIR